ncbi:MAG: MarR family transcriptional regulator [Chlorobiales bacterium]|nr:MarR family transcriptional regulator [Chlorobiales bacterium]
MDHSRESDVFTKIVLEVFKLGGLLAAEGDRLTKDIGLTSARWKVLGALSIAGQPMTVARIAKTMGQTRQGVQRIADEMANEGIVAYQDNPNHKRAMLVAMTPKGKNVYEVLTQIQIPWAYEKSKDIDLKDMETALHVLQILTKKFEE